MDIATILSALAISDVVARRAVGGLPVKHAVFSVSPVK
jgi:hypothetical protein